MKLIIGLGNPGLKYKKTRHNLGFMAIDNYLKNIKWLSANKANYYKTKINNVDVIFVKPLTYMNLSGEAVLFFVNYYKISINDILIIHDDLDIPFGDYKLKRNSGSGGHNGIKSIINILKTDEFLRIKIGISKPKDILNEDFVLQKFSKFEIIKINNLLNFINMIIEDFIVSENNIDAIINKYNGGRNEVSR